MNTTQRMNKDTIPTNFTLGLAIFDFVPVILFCLLSIVLGLSFSSIIFIVGSTMCFISGLLKVIWKIIVATKKRNIWFMFIQMRIAMPIGFLIMIIGFIYYCFTNDVSIFFNSLLNPFVLVFLVLGVIGMILMIIFAFKLDSSSAKSNWIEQITNSASQLFLFIGFLIALLIR